ncbi:MAG: hypothetical protein M1546_07570 [Chloroflexi bacterium]|nr:hypothetical protein [Chloroflexota bacterium]
MRCPKCDHPVYRSTEPCPNCRFSGDAALIDELDHIKWLLGQIGAWSAIGAWARDTIAQRYNMRRSVLELTLGLRLPLFTDDEARREWPDLRRREHLARELVRLSSAGLLLAPAVQALSDAFGLHPRQLDDLRERFTTHARLRYPNTRAEQLEWSRYLLQALDFLGRQHGFASPEAEAQVRAPVLAEIERLEIKLGLRSRASVGQATRTQLREEAVATAAAAEKAMAVDAATEGGVPSPPVPPPPFLDRLWRSLVSERTLQAVLFLGIFLLFAAAVSFVIWGWATFSVPLRIAIPAGFTALFFALGEYVRARIKLYRSGVALNAIAALLIPIDFYTVYANVAIRHEDAALFWLIVSLVCLLAYVAVALLIQNRFFGYLVGVATGSTALALVELLHEYAGLSLDWRPAALSLVSTGLIVLATRMDRHSVKSAAVSTAVSTAVRVQVLAEPFRYLALLTAGVLMPLTFGLRYVGRAGYDTWHDAMSVCWWLGGFVFGWGAVFYRSRSLGVLAAVSLPASIYFAQAALFQRAGIRPAWHALGWALLVPIYFLVAYRLLPRTDDAVLRWYGRTAAGWGVALSILAAVWSLTDLTSGTAAAASHMVLAGAMVLAALWWKRPRYLYAASFLSFTACTFAMVEVGLDLSQVGVGWASLSLVHVIVALLAGSDFRGFLPGQARTRETPLDPAGLAHPLVIAGFVIAALALLPGLFPYDGNTLAYTLGHWLGLSAWSALLAQRGRAGFVSGETDSGHMRVGIRRAVQALRPAVFHWFTAVPLPFWIWVLLSNRGPLNSHLPLVLTALALGMLLISYHLRRRGDTSHWPWYGMSVAVSVAAPISAFAVAPESVAPGFSLLALGLAYVADAFRNQVRGSRSAWLPLAPGALALAWGSALLLEWLHVPTHGVNVALVLLAGVYLVGGLSIEPRKRSWVRLSPIFTRRFMSPLYIAAHVLALVVLVRIYGDTHTLLALPATDEALVWAALCQVLLGVAYGLVAWGTYDERWAHVAAWLGVAGGGLIAIAYSTGQGSSAAKAALMAIALVLAERALYRLKTPGFFARVEVQHCIYGETGGLFSALARLAWRLYRRPLLLTGWVASAGVIGLALVRNLVLLGGGRVQQWWAAVALLMMVALYALSARLFRRALFSWLAALLAFAPWTILSNLGWLTPYRFTSHGLAMSWAVLGVGLFGVALLLRRFGARSHAQAYQVTAHGLMLVALLWGARDNGTSCFTFALAIGLYAVSARVDLAARPDRPSIWLYPALGLFPAWCAYLMATLVPWAPREHTGVLMLALAPLGMATGEWLSRRWRGNRLFGLPAYLTCYGAFVAGVLLVSHLPLWLAAALAYGALLMLVSGVLFRQAAWSYVAAVLLPVALLIALSELGVPANRHGWWLIGLAAGYLLGAFALRPAGRLEQQGVRPLQIVGFALVAAGVALSGQDRTGAFWGYGSAALIYATAAFWLRQPALLSPACVLALVPYAVALREDSLAPQYDGLALYPGAIAMLGLGLWLDSHIGRWHLAKAPAGKPLSAWAGRWLNDWSLPLYTVGLGMVMVSPLFATDGGGRRWPDMTALAFALQTLVFAWAIYRFRRPIWLLALVLSAHFAFGYTLDALGLWRDPTQAWLRFLLVPVSTLLVALLVEHRPHWVMPRDGWRWAQPLYGLLLCDLVVGQTLSFNGTAAGAAISLAHAFVLAVWATNALSTGLAYASASAAVLALLQWWLAQSVPLTSLPVVIAQLALAFGLVGYALRWLRASVQTLPAMLARRIELWAAPLQCAGLGLSVLGLAAMALLGVNLADWSARALLGFAFRDIVDMAIVQMAVSVFALIGLLYLTAAFSHRRPRFGYVAVALLLFAWSLHAFYVQRWDDGAQVQWYALPAGLYLMGISLLEWQRGNKALARWIDYAALALMLGSLFWQTLLFGWHYALMLGLEGGLSFWWGSARRLRRFLYGGMAAIVLATAAQLINSLQSVNQWIVFGVIGLLMVIAGLIVERRLKQIKAWQETLGAWE